MIYPRRKSIASSVGILAFCVALAAATWSIRLPSGLRPLPEIEDYWQVQWLGSDALLLTPDPFAERLKEGKLKVCPTRFDLKTGKRTPLTFLPNDAIGPIPSPDGHWLLYKETRGGGTLQNAKPYKIRWRLVGVDGSKARLFPSDGSFRPTPNEIGYPTDGHDAFAIVTLNKTGLSAWYARLLHRPENDAELWRFPLDGTRPTRLAIIPPNTYSLDISPDEKRLLLKSYDAQVYMVPL
ncbi:TolB family protein [Armatimonas sp.]|uniref:TolB family protein n=1 Tax=Armatimonas sp. TaxID=1872638 RepID=UPI003750DF47